MRCHKRGVVDADVLLANVRPLIPIDAELETVTRLRAGGDKGKRKWLILKGRSPFTARDVTFCEDRAPGIEIGDIEVDNRLVVRVVVVDHQVPDCGVRARGDLSRVRAIL